MMTVLLDWFIHVMNFLFSLPHWTTLFYLVEDFLEKIEYPVMCIPLLFMMLGLISHLIIYRKMKPSQNIGVVSEQVKQTEEVATNQETGKDKSNNVPKKLSIIDVVKDIGIKATTNTTHPIGMGTPTPKQSSTEQSVLRKITEDRRVWIGGAFVGIGLVLLYRKYG